MQRQLGRCNLFVDSAADGSMEARTERMPASIAVRRDNCTHFRIACGYETPKCVGGYERHVARNDEQPRRLRFYESGKNTPKWA